MAMGSERWPGDGSWAKEGRGAFGQIALVTFGILALELALIRWTSGQMRVFAYFNNVVLICAFLGMGLGVALGRRWPGLVHGVAPAVLVLAVPLAFSEALGLVRLPFPDQSIILWGAEGVEADAWIFTRNLSVFLLMLTGVAGVFTVAGAPLGFLLGRRPILSAYTFDLAGSLAGIGAFTLLAWAEAGPAWWLALGLAPFVWLSRRTVGTVAAVLVSLLGHYSAQDAVYSPYNRIELRRDSQLTQELQVNRDFHQYLHDLNPARLRDAALDDSERAVLWLTKDLYELPFVVNRQRGSALIVGAGTGNDVAAALGHGYTSVTSVDIDGRIIEFGRQLHPARPYADARVRAVVADARSYFSREPGEKYDVVCYGLLDSHAMVSAMSTLRLDNYVYTEEGIRAAWRKVAPGGHLSLSISCLAGRWFFERIYWTVTKATGREPVAIHSPLHGETTTFIVPTAAAGLDAGQLERRTRILPYMSGEQTLTPTDDWPFLYIRPGVVPWGYFAVLGFLLCLALATVPRVYGMDRGGAFDWPLFLMGAAFLLIETRGVTSLSLLFGSTWIVNSAVFGGILTMVLLANLAVQRWSWQNPLPWFAALFGSVLLLWWLPVEQLSQMPLAVRGAVGGLLTGLPVGLAGVIVPMLLARSAQPVAALGANLLGAVLGGCLEYISMFGGLKSVALMALVLYLTAYLIIRRKFAPAPAS